MFWFSYPAVRSTLSCSHQGEEDMLDQYYRSHLTKIMKFHQSTPLPVLFTFGGCLPLSAVLHLRVLSLFGQICRYRQGDNILAAQARSVLSSSMKQSWFWMVRNICLKRQFSLSDKLRLFNSKFYHEFDGVDIFCQKLTLLA